MGAHGITPSALACACTNSCKSTTLERKHLCMFCRSDVWPAGCGVAEGVGRE